VACDFFTVDLLDGTQAYVLAVSSTHPGASGSSASPSIPPVNGPPSKPVTSSSTLTSERAGSSS
jgi:hypothetical protein